MGILQRWGLTFEDIDEITTANPSLQSFVMGYGAEVMFRRRWLDGHQQIHGVYKPDDHDRSEKADWIITYKGTRLRIEVKSLQSDSLKPLKSGLVKPKFQCDASDARTVHFEDGSSVHTTYLLVGEFDVLAVNLLAMTGQWDFVFCLNSELQHPDGKRGKSKNYTQYQRDRLIKGTPELPMESASKVGAPYSYDLYEVLDRARSLKLAGELPDLSGIDIEEDDE